jgi:hypothetical protein
MFLRMGHIERAHGLHAFRYTQYLDHPELLKHVRLPEENESDILKLSARRNKVGIHDHQKAGP